MAESFRTSGLPGIAVDSRNLAKVLRELRDLEPNLRKELVKEMKSEIMPEILIEIASMNRIFIGIRKQGMKREDQPNRKLV